MIRRTLRLEFHVLLLLGTLATSAAAQHDDAALRSAARKMAEDGVALLQQEQPDAASQKLEKAYRLLPVPSVALWSARALVARRLLVEASERYRETGRLSGFKADPQVQLQAQQEAARELEALTPRIPLLVIDVTLDSAAHPSITLDGELLPAALVGEEQPVNPGTHEIRIAFAGKLVTRTITIAEAEKRRESITLNDDAASAPSAPVNVGAPAPTPADTRRVTPEGKTQRTLAVVALAAGGAGLVLGGVTGALAWSKHDTLTDSGGCAAERCPASARSEVDSLNTLRSLSSVGFIAGGVLATTGVVLLLTTDNNTAVSAPSGLRLSMRVTPRALAVSGAF
jgi:hypothetical protein